MIIDNLIKFVINPSDQVEINKVSAWLASHLRQLIALFYINSNIGKKMTH